MSSGISTFYTGETFQKFIGYNFKSIAAFIKGKKLSGVLSHNDRQYVFENGRRVNTRKKRYSDHAKTLSEYFGIPKLPKTFLRELCRLETLAHKYAESLCNIGGECQKDYGALLKEYLRSIGATKNLENIFYNRDPRGYALKVKNPPRGMCRDSGEYGIICPDFT